MRQSLRKLNTRILTLALAFMLLLCVVPAASAAEASGTCGSNLNWSLSGDTLTITGSGAMSDYTEEALAPWHEYRREIARVVLPEGLTRIGALAFYNCTALEFVSVPDSVTQIGKHAFYQCTGMTMLDLSSSLKIIEDGAFRECSALPAVRLPESLTEIGYRSFYRCSSLTSIKIPSSVTKMGSCAFSFCYNLIRAEIAAPVTVLPVWTFYGCSHLVEVTLPATLETVEEFAFYGCDDLIDVVYNGSDENKEQIEEDIRRDKEGQPNETIIVDEPKEELPTTTDFENNSNGDVVGNTTTTTETENTSFSATVTVTYFADDSRTRIARVNVTLETAAAWSEIVDRVIKVVDEADETTADVYIKDNTALGNDAIEPFIGENMVMTIHNAGGSVWKLDFRRNESVSEEKKDGGLLTRIGKLRKETETTYDLSYERQNATAEQLELMGCTVGYQIRFLSNAKVDAEVMIKLPRENARRKASLYQTKDNDKELLQTVVVDDAGYAHFYLAAVDTETQYLIGIDVQEAATAGAIVPEVLREDYGITEQLSAMEYVVTGRESSWGMTINQVTFFLVVGMVTAIVVVGGVMFVLNKRRLKMGYIPDIGDEEEE